MRIGIICEGKYTDKPVIESILGHEFPEHEFEIKARDKGAIFFPCYQDINSLVTEGFTKIVILWDLLPVGNQMAVPSQWSEKPSRKEQRQLLLQNLLASEELHKDAKDRCNRLAIEYGFAEGPIENCEVDICLVCICYTMDGWLLSDHSVLRELGSTNAHAVAQLDPKPNSPDKSTRPVQELTELFKRCPNKRFRYYNKHTHNKDIIQAYINSGRLNTLRASGSYSRLIDAIGRWITL